MPIPIAIPAGALTVTDAITARAERFLEAFIRSVNHGTTGGSLDTPACTIDDRAGGVTPVIIDTAEKQLFTRHSMMALAAVLGSKGSGEAVGSTNNPTSGSATFVGIPEMTVTITTIGGPVLVIFSGTFDINAADALDFTLFEGATEFAASRRSLVSANTIGLTAGTQALFTSLAAGSHTFTAQWRQTAGSARGSGTKRSLTVVEL